MYQPLTDLTSVAPAQGFASLSQTVRATLKVLEARVPVMLVFAGRTDADSPELLVIDAHGEERLPLPDDVSVGVDVGFHVRLAADRARRYALKPGTRPVPDSGAVIPLALSDGTVAGALSAVVAGDGSLEADDRELLDLGARIVARELDRRRSERALETLNSRLRQQAQDLAELDRVGRELATAADFRRAVCDAARGLVDAPLAVLYEPTSSGALEPTASAGGGEDVLSKLDMREAATRAFQEGTTVTLASAQKHAGASARLSLVHARETLLAEPMNAGDRAVGVLVVGWKERFSDLSRRTVQVVGMLAMEATVAIEQRRREGQLSDLARTDPLTGLPNRRAWEELFVRELARAARSKAPLSIAVLDLDRFKLYNDERGHEAGDRLLIDAARGWSANLREGDLLARIGGEEFTVLLPDCATQGAVVVVDRIRAATPNGQTCSAGVAQWDGSESPTALLARADRALYNAKSAGRDRTGVAP